MLRFTLVIALALFVILPFEAYAQDSATRTRELVAALDKTKYKKKEKANITVEVYIDIKNHADVRPASDYAGSYQSEDGGYQLRLSVDGSGSASGSGQDLINGDRPQAFTLRDARIVGALLIGTKVYDNGVQEKFEAVFVNRTVAAGKNVNEIATRETASGIGFIQNGTWSDTQKGTTNTWTNRVFLERR